MNRIAELFICQERRMACFVAGPGQGDRKCASCIRKRYGGPSCCDEGWERWRSKTDPGGCINWIGWDADLAGPDTDTPAERP